MAGFIYRGPLPPNSPLFYGRDSILQKLKSACQGDVQSYAIVYGGRQNGKTTLLLRLQAELSASARICVVDFQGLPNAPTPDVFDFIVKQMASQLGDDSSPSARTAPDLVAYFKRACMLFHQNIVLVFEELGALPPETRNDLANVVRSVFTNRFGAQNTGLNKFMVVFAGGIELYELAASQVSTLHNICESFYLNDLTELESHSLLEKGFSLSGVIVDDLEALTGKVFDQAHGHPYLTQKIGALLAEEISAGKKVNGKTINAITASLLQDDVLLRHIANGLREYNLLKSCAELLEGKVKFSRFDEEMARLELFGIAKESNGRWSVRNPLLKQALLEWIGKQKLPEETAEQAGFNASTSIGGNVAQGIIVSGNGNTIQIVKEDAEEGKSNLE
jgi:hypothetical protein